MRRHYVASTSIARYFDVMFLQGWSEKDDKRVHQEEQVPEQAEYSLTIEAKFPLSVLFWRNFTRKGIERYNSWSKEEHLLQIIESIIQFHITDALLWQFGLESFSARKDTMIRLKICSFRETFILQDTFSRV